MRSAVRRTLLAGRRFAGLDDEPALLGPDLREVRQVGNLSTRLPFPAVFFDLRRVLAEGRWGTPHRRAFAVHEHRRGEHP